MRSLVAAQILLFYLPAAAQVLDALFCDGMAAVEEAYSETAEDRRDALLDEAVAPSAPCWSCSRAWCACGSNSPAPSS